MLRSMPSLFYEIMQHWRKKRRKCSAVSDGCLLLLVCWNIAFVDVICRSVADVTLCAGIQPIDGDTSCSNFRSSEYVQSERYCTKPLVKFQRKNIGDSYSALRLFMCPGETHYKSGRVWGVFLTDRQFIISHKSRKSHKERIVALACCHPEEKHKQSAYANLEWRFVG